MSFQVQALENIVAKEIPLAYPSFELMTPKALLTSDWLPTIKEVYGDLGGISAKLPLSIPTPKALSFEQLTIVWDAEYHFNRYRGIALRAAFYGSFPAFSLNNYRLYCRRYEKFCLKAGMAGNLWTNPKAEQFFGKAEVPGDLGGNGSPQWKLQAFYDLLTDISFLQKGTNMLRISPWEELMFRGKRHQIGEILLKGNAEIQEVLGRYILRKAAQAYPES